MPYTRLLMQAFGAALILIAVGMLYYQTDLRNTIPEGVAIAVLVALTGLFVIGFSNSFRSYRRYQDVEHHEHVDARPVRPLRPVRTYERVERVDPAIPADRESHEVVETIERRD